MIVVDTAAKDIDGVWYDLPDNLRAAKPEEVGTVVWVTWGKDQVDTYENGAPAYVQTCKVTVIDKQTQTVLWDSQQFRGDEPPMEIDFSASEGSGSKPTEQVVDYLKGLPKL